jgi:Fe-S cluster biogenesis protein NfuA
MNSLNLQYAKMHKIRRFFVQQQHRQYHKVVIETPNPSSYKFLFNNTCNRAMTIRSVSEAIQQESSLAQQLFTTIQNVKTIFMTPQFITITMHNESSWDDTVKSNVTNTIRNHGMIVQEEEAAAEEEVEQVYSSEIIEAIQQVLELQVRPLLQDDGGDVRFVKFDEDDGKVYVQLRGSCEDCSSSKITLRFRIESTLKHYVPEVTQVISVDDISSI